MIAFRCPLVALIHSAISSATNGDKIYVATMWGGTDVPGKTTFVTQRGPKSGACLPSVPVPAKVRCPSRADLYSEPNEGPVWGQAVWKRPGDSRAGRFR